MIKKIIYLAFLLPLAGNAQTTVIKPLVKQPTAFAIIQITKLMQIPKMPCISTKLRLKMMVWQLI